MFQVSKYILPAIAITHEELLTTYLPGDHYKPSVPVFEQQTTLRHLDEEIHRENIYFSISLVENRIVHCNGVARWLGYADSDFSLRDYLEIIHPAHAAVEGYYSLALLELFMHNEISLRFMQPVCATIIALKHKNGKYICCKRECAPFQLTKENRMTEYLCYFNVIKEFSNEIYHTRLYPGSEHSIYTAEKLLALVRKKFTDHTDFSMQESRILKRYAQQKNCTSEMIGKAFKIEKTTVNTYNKRILKKAEAFSQQRFGTAKEASLYFKKVGLI